MENSAAREIEIPGGHLDRRRDQRRLVIVTHRPANYLACRAVDGRGEIEPPFPGWEIGNVADHLRAGHFCTKVPVHQVRDRAGLALDGGGRPPRPRLAGHQAQLAQQGADQLRPCPHAPAGQLPPDPPVPVRAVGIVKGLLDQELELLPPSRGCAFRPGPPFVIPRSRHFEPCAHARDRRSGRAGGVLRIDELIHLAHRCSAAKYAAAFERNSFFARSSRFSRSSSRSRARSDSCNGGSSPACFSRYARTQLPSEVSLIPSSRATSAIGRDVSTTIRAASSRNSGVNFRYFPDT